MKQRIKIFLASIGVLSMLAFAGTAPTTVQAVDPGFGACTGNSTSTICKARNTDNVFNVIKNVVNILITVVGIVAVVMIVVGGLRYVTSGGDANGVTGAKNTILYAVVGLVIAIMSFSIVNFVIFRI